LKVTSKRKKKQPKVLLDAEEKKAEKKGNDKK
jgi:hypothetical protein